MNNYLYEENPVYLLCVYILVFLHIEVTKRV